MHEMGRERLEGGALEAMLESVYRQAEWRQTRGRMSLKTRSDDRPRCHRTSLQRLCAEWQTVCATCVCAAPASCHGQDQQPLKTDSCFSRSAEAMPGCALELRKSTKRLHSPLWPWLLRPPHAGRQQESHQELCCGGVHDWRRKVPNEKMGARSMPERGGEKA